MISKEVTIFAVSNTVFRTGNYGRMSWKIAGDRSGFLQTYNYSDSSDKK